MAVSVPAEKVALIADDNPFIRSSLEAVLERWGYIVLTAENGASLVRLAQAFQIEFIITDIEMPGMTGLQAVAQIRRECEHLRYAPIIALSSRDGQEDKDLCFEAGIDQLVSKRQGFVGLMEALAPFNPALPHVTER